jgi:multiple sugar transport system permease protein
MPMVVTNPTFAMPALVLANAWHQYPMVMVFVLAALQTIPQELVEASRIDGATAWQHFRLVTMPLISNTILVSVILTAMHTFNNASIVFIMTGGGPLGLTETLATRVFIEGFKLFRTGPASAIAVLCFAANVVLALTFIRVLRAPRGTS